METEKDIQAIKDIREVLRESRVVSHQVENIEEGMDKLEIKEESMVPKESLR